MILILFAVSFCLICPSCRAQLGEGDRAAIIRNQSDTIAIMQRKLHYLNEKLENIISGKVPVRSKHRGEPGPPGTHGQPGVKGDDIKYDDPLIQHLQHQIGLVQNMSNNLHGNITKLFTNLSQMKFLPETLTTRLNLISNNLDQHVHFFQDIVANKGILLEVGDQGLDGPPGEDGSQGGRGIKGNRGRQGPKGDSSSLAGLPGVPGDGGRKGLEGRPGSPGLDGITGHKGNRGIPGLKGEKGSPEGL